MLLRPLAALSVLLLATPARADAADDYFARLAAAVDKSIDGVLAQRTPKLVPPVPVKLTWRAVRLGSVDLGAPLVAMTAADLDHDGRAELYAVTTREVVAIGAAKRVAELGRVAFVGDPAVPASRDPVGTVTVDGGAIVASSSAWDSELRVTWQNGALAAQQGQGGQGALACPGERLARVPGRNHYGDAIQPIYAVRCADLVDPLGAPIHVRAALTDKRLEVTIERCAPKATRGTAGCLPVAKYDFKDYGSELEVGDVDRDGKPELIVTGAGAPGDPDAVKVITLGGDEKRGLFRKSFNGGVAGIAIGDADGDGAPEVIAAVRLAGATRVDLWRLD